MRQTGQSRIQRGIVHAMLFLCLWGCLSELAQFVPLLTGADFIPDGFTTEQVYAKTARKKVKITDSQVRRFLHKSCFIGNSVQLGRANFTKANRYTSMGRPLFMARVSYSFLNDRYKNHGFMIQYNGREMQARYAIKASGKKYAFINMGMNDLGMPVGVAYSNYVRYLKEIRKTNPKVVIFIEACTPMRSDKANLNNKNIRALNKRMRQYANDNKQVCYVETNQPLRDKQGKLKRAYCSDNYVHLTAAGAEKWNSVTFRYARQYLKKRKLHQLKVREIKKRRAQPTTDIVRWSKKTKHLYYNNDKIVKGVAFYKDKFYAFTKKKGTFKKSLTKKLRKAYKPNKDAARLIKLLGKPKKTIFQDSCYGEGQYREGIREYKLFILNTLKNTETGKEIIYGVSSKY